MTELGLLADQIGASERTLRRAVNQGALKGTWRSPRRLDISAAEKRYARRSWSLLAALRNALRTEPNVRFAALFGSAARGEDEPGSDVDLVVAMRDGGLDRVIDLATKLGEATDRRVDLLELKEVEAHTELLLEVTSDARVLIDRDGLWTPLSQRARRLRKTADQSEQHRLERALNGIDALLARH